MTWTKHPPSRYQNRGCRCPNCIAAHNAYQRKRNNNMGPGICNFCETNGTYARGLCKLCYVKLFRLMRIGRRTEEELILGGYLNA